MSNKTKNKNAEFYTNDLISDSPNSSEKGDKGKRKLDGSGKGTRENKGRGGCSPEEQKEAPTKTKKDNSFFYEYSADFKDDGSAYNYNLLRELADSWKSFTTESDPAKSRRAHQLFRELFEDLKSKLNELDKLKRK